MDIITAETPVWTVEQARAYNARHPERSWCSHAHPNFPYEFRGEGLETKAYCMVCGRRGLGVAAERDFRPNGYIAADIAYMTSPATVAKLKQIALDWAKARIKFGPLGRRRIISGPTDRYGW
jgi:hypothetical protein